MELMPKSLKEKFKKYPLGSQDGLGKDAVVVVKYFNPVGAATWLITEGQELKDGDYELYGYCFLGDIYNAEVGYVNLSDLKNIRCGFGLGIERDLYLKENCTVAEAMKQCGIDDYEHVSDLMGKEV